MPAAVDTFGRMHSGAFGPREKDTCRDLILPMLHDAGWTDAMIRPEYPVAADRVITSGGVERELGDGRVDYVLEAVPGVPVAVVEVKREYAGAAQGLQQAIRYAQQLDVPITYASNGHEIIERDMATGRERVVESVATPTELWFAFQAFHGLAEQAAELIAQPFDRKRTTVLGDVITPRYYQAVAVHRVLKAMAAGQRRLLLLMATGTGKTFTAMQLVAKLYSYERQVRPDRNYRVLYLADLDVLLRQPMDKEFQPAFTAEPLKRVKGRVDRSREIYFASYQAMSGPGDADTLFADYPPDFFDLVIVDECHRGSASPNSSWRAVLDHFAPAVQLGLTATPKRDDNVDSYDYFGNPLYEYSLRQGIEDGFLAPYRVRRVVLSPDAEGWQPDPGQLDRFGRDIPRGVYATRDFERVVSLLVRTRLAARHLSKTLRKDPTARAMVFCVDQEHAEDMRSALVEANPDLVQRDPEWVVRIVGSEPERVRLLEAFTDAESSSPVVATTSRLLSTGVDVQDLKFVVLFRPVGSIVEFKQIIGRGTRLYPDKGKASFEIIDYVGATRHFTDPDFDGFPLHISVETVDPDGEVIDENEEPTGDDGGDGDGGSGEHSDDDVGDGDRVAEPEPDFEPSDPEPGPDDERAGPVNRRRKLYIDEGAFEVLAESTHVPDTSTGQLRLTEYGEYVAGQVRLVAGTPDELSSRWSAGPSRDQITQHLISKGVDLAELVAAEQLASCDPLDVLIQLAWNVAPRARAERVRRVRDNHHADLEQLSDRARAVLAGLLDRYASHGIEDMTSIEVLRVEPLRSLGSSVEIAREFGGATGYHERVDELQRWLYSA